MAPKHAFAAKSPAQRAADIRPGEAWRATAVGWNKAASKLQLSVAHHESNTPVEAFHPDDNMLGALCLFWAVAVETLPPLDIGTLQQRDVNFHWGTYQAAMTNLLAYLAAAPSDALHQLQQAAAAHVSPFGDTLRASSPDQFLMLLAGDESPKRPLERVPLVHWLLTWQASHRKRALRCQILPQADTRLPAPCPLSLQQWNAEIFATNRSYSTLGSCPAWPSREPNSLDPRALNHSGRGCSRSRAPWPPPPTSRPRWSSWPPPPTVTRSIWPSPSGSSAPTRPSPTAPLPRSAQWRAGDHWPLPSRRSGMAVQRPYVPEEGWNQGDSPSGDTYQVGELVVSGSLPHTPEVQVPHRQTSVPVSNLSYSDNCRLVRPTLLSLVELMRHCTRVKVAREGLVHMDKLRFFALELTNSGLHQITSTVPYYLTPTSQATPKIAGIALSCAFKPPDAYADLAKQVTRMRRRIESLPTTTIPALRSLPAFILLQLDYIASGVAIPPEHIEDLAIQLRAYYRHVLGLPCWTSRALLALPLSYGGPGCPHVPLRSACLLLLTYTQATCSRSLLAHRSAQYLAETSLPSGEARPLRAADQQLSVEVSLFPDPAISAMPVHSDTSPSVLHTCHRRRTSPL